MHTNTDTYDEQDRTWTGTWTCNMDMKAWTWICIMDMEMDKHHGFQNAEKKFSPP
jgi:hypothetical protein